MRLANRLAALGLVIVCGCGAAPDARKPLMLATAGPEASTLNVAFDDISADRKDEPPMSLTASDGTGLQLVAMSARVVVDDPLAFTEMTLVFDNPNDRVLEGTFRITLPPGAAISRFAMRNTTGWMEGEIVEKQKARVAYEDFLHRRQDPALLEQAAGNEVSARVFPIPARGRKELIVSYSQEVTRSRPYALPLKGLPQIGSVDVMAFVAGQAAPAMTLSKRDVVPEADFKLDAKLSAGRSGVRNGNLVLARVTPILGSQPDPLGSTLVLLDTSASRALGLSEEGRLAMRISKAIAKAAGPKTPVVIAAYDQEVDAVYDGPADGVGDAILATLRQRLALGASDLGRALAWAGDRAKAQRFGRVMLLTDGIATAGNTEGDKLRAAVAALGSAGIERLDAIVVGGIRDEDLLRSLANGNLKKGGVVLDGGLGEEEMTRRLSEATRSGVEIKIEEATFVFPSRVDGVQAGDDVLVYANVPQDKPVRISVGGGPIETPTLAQVERPLLERAWVGAKIKSLEEMERKQGASKAISDEIVKLSTQYRVLSSRTGLLVLESDWDYARFGIGRDALADILVTDGGKVSVMKRSAPPQPKPTPVAPTNPSPKTIAATKPAKRKADEAGGLGSLGSLGSGAASGAPAPSDDSFGGEDAPRAPAQDPGPSVRTEAAPGLPRPAAAPPPPPPQTGRASEPERRAAADRAPAATASPIATGTAPSRRAPREAAEFEEKKRGEDPYTGPFKEVMDLVAANRVEAALKRAFAWRKESPGDVLALVALGEGFEAARDPRQASRAYGSIIDLFPARADLRRFAGERLERLASDAAADLAADTFAKAEIERADHPSSHRLLAFSLAKRGKLADAFEAAVRGLRQRYPAGRFAGVQRILAEDLGLIGAAWIRAEPSRKDEIERRIREEGGLIEDQPSLRFVLNWETDANDVDFHIFDNDEGHAFFRHPSLPSGGSLYADVTTGYGPECFTIRSKPADRAGPYTLQAHYYSRGPMGYGMGKLQIIEHDGQGKLTFEERPFIVMQDHAFVELGIVK